MNGLPPGSHLMDQLFPYTTLSRSRLARPLARRLLGAGALGYRRHRPIGDVHGLAGNLRPQRLHAAFPCPRAGALWAVSGGVMVRRAPQGRAGNHRSEEHTSELQSLIRISYAVLSLKKTKKTT